MSPPAPPAVAQRRSSPPSSTGDIFFAPSAAAESRRAERCGQWQTNKFRHSSDPEFCEVHMCATESAIYLSWSYDAILGGVGETGRANKCRRKTTFAALLRKWPIQFQDRLAGLRLRGSCCSLTGADKLTCKVESLRNAPCPSRGRLQECVCSLYVTSQSGCV